MFCQFLYSFKYSIIAKNFTFFTNLFNLSLKKVFIHSTELKINPSKSHAQTNNHSPGSLTDSVCTAYENKIQKPSDKTETDPETAKSNVSDSESAFAPVTNLTSMLGGK